MDLQLSTYLSDVLKLSPAEEKFGALQINLQQLSSSFCVLLHLELLLQKYHPGCERESCLSLWMVWCDGLKMPRGKWLSILGDLQMGFSFSTDGWVLLGISSCSMERWAQRRAGQRNGIFLSLFFCIKLMYLCTTKEKQKGARGSRAWEWMMSAMLSMASGGAALSVSFIWSHHQIIPTVIKAEGQGCHLGRDGISWRSWNRRWQLVWMKCAGILWPPTEVGGPADEPAVTQGWSTLCLLWCCSWPWTAREDSCWSSS